MNKFVILGLYLWCISLSVAQERLEFDKINIEDGLSHSSVLDMIQDSRGFIWVGTQHGLNRFDGYDFKTYNFNLEDQQSISSNFILSIFEDSTGLIWVGTSNGLNSYNPVTTKFTRYLHKFSDPNSISNDHITSITEDQFGFIWIGTAGGGLNRLDKNTQTFQNIPLKHKNNQENSFITTLLLDSKGVLWVANGNARLRPSQQQGGIFRVDTESLVSTQVIPIIDSKPLNTINGINSIFEDNKNNLWFGTLGQGLLQKPANDDSFIQHFNDTLSNQNTILDIVQDKNGFLWLATQYSGIFKFNPDNLKFYNYSNSNNSNLSDDDITSLLVDNTGVFWLGTWTDGVNRFDFDSLQFTKHLQYQNKTESIKYQILGINQDFKERLWLAAWDNQLLEYSIKTNSYIKHDLNEIADDLIIRTIYSDSSGALWLGSNDHGLIYYQPETKELRVYQNHPNDKFSINNNQVIKIIADPNENLWIATRGGGVNYFNIKENKFYAYDQASSGIDNRISSLFYDDLGHLWIGSYEGLFLFDTKNKTLIKHYVGNQGPNSFNGKDINDIYQDRQKRIWIGTEKGFSQVVFDENGNRNNLNFKWRKEFVIGSVGGILQGPMNNLWISSFKKIIKYNPNTKTMTHFDSSHGVLPSGYYIGASFINNKNTLFFGGLDGFTTFNPENIKINQLVPKIELTKLLLFNKEVVPNNENDNVLNKNITDTKNIVFNYKQNVFSLEFSALHYASSKNNQYAYKLEGFDENWIYTDSDNRRATYTNLDAGNYNFLLKASNKDGVWSDVENKLSITVDAAPWLTTWAYLIYAFILTSIVGSFIWLRQKQLQAIKTRNEQLSLTSKLFENTSECVWLLDHEFKYLTVNDGFCKVTGVDKKRVIGQKIRVAEIEGKQDKEFSESIFKSIKEHGKWSGEMWDQRVNGEIYPVEIVIDRITIENKNKKSNEFQYVGVFSDITNRKQTEEDLRNMAYFDPLTSLGNRSYFKLMVQKEIDLNLSPGEFIIFYFDLDNFKDTNDSLGHSYGDRLLIAIANRLKEFSNNDYLVARLGGDEFAIMVPNKKVYDSTTKVALDIAENILNTINKKLKLKTYSSYVTASIGVSVYPYDGSTHEELLRNADTAMYHAKKQGKNNAVLFSKNMNDAARERLMLMDELNNGIKHKEFLPFFQPKACLRSGKIKGVEVLARWNNKNLGMVSPVRFIPVAEESKMITDISEQLMKQAFKIILPSIESGEFKGRISFNVSITQFSNQDIVSWIDQILGECQFPSEYLELEITESMVMENIDGAIEIMKQLHSRNISISIDDFGTGYSSLSYLKKFPIDIIKIDKSFVSDLMYSEEDRKIVTSIIHLAHNLGLKVVAEGGETLDQIQFLKELGCEEVQGFYYCKPLKAEDYLSFLKRDINLFNI